MCVTKNNEVNLAMKELDIAENQFDYAENDFIDAAIARINYARIKLETLLKLAKIEKA